MKSVLTKHQKRTHTKVFTENGIQCMIKVELRFDDECGNGHNTFAITADLYERGKQGGYKWFAGGCCHDEIVKHFPEFKHLIKWHGCTTEGPLHYIANTLYHAGDRDCHGLRKGEFKHHLSRGQYQAGGVEGVPCWELRLPEGFEKEIYSNECPNPVILHWQPYGRIGEGKERELDYARSSAIWPDATDEQLTSDNLEQMLKDRLPALMEEFKTVIESLGFVY